MNKQNLMPQAAQPVHRTTTGQLPPELAELSEATLSLVRTELSEATLSLVGVDASTFPDYSFCSYDGDDAE